MTTATLSAPPAARAPERNATGFDLGQHGITVSDVRRNLSPAELYKEAIREDAQCDIAQSGALIALSGEKTGRSPKDKRVVVHPDSKDEVDAIQSGELGRCPTVADAVFGFAVPTECPGVPGDILVPRNTWSNSAAYDATARKLAGLFRDNFTKYAEGTSPEVAATGPRRLKQTGSNRVYKRITPL